MITRVLVAYQHCVTRKEARTATIAQQKRYWRIKGDFRCPRKIFRSQLMELLVKWRSNGEKLIVMMDGNENMINGHIQRMFSGKELMMRDVLNERTGKNSPATFIRGSRQIDAVWATPDIEVTSASLLPFHFGIGDHRAIMIDITNSSLFGSSSKTICRPHSRRLQCNRYDIMDKYNCLLENYCIHHRLQSKLYSLQHGSYTDKNHLQKKLDSIDRVLGEGMLHCERQCRKYRVGEVPFSPTLA